MLWSPPPLARAESWRRGRYVINVFVSILSRHIFCCFQEPQHNVWIPAGPALMSQYASPSGNWKMLFNTESEFLFSVFFPSLNCKPIISRVWGRTLFYFIWLRVHTDDQANLAFRRLSLKTFQIHKPRHFIPFCCPYLTSFYAPLKGSSPSSVLWFLSCHFQGWPPAWVTHVDRI